MLLSELLHLVLHLVLRPDLHLLFHPVLLLVLRLVHPAAVRRHQKKQMLLTSLQTQNTQHR